LFGHTSHKLQEVIPVETVKCVPAAQDVHALFVFVVHAVVSYVPAAHSPEHVEHTLSDKEVH
jgi:hypothetical protein